MIRTNELIVDINYTNILEKYDIFCVSLVPEEGLTDRDKKKYIGAHIFDIVDFEYNALSVLYRYGNKMYCLFKKDEVNIEILQNTIEKSKNLKVDIKCIDSWNNSQSGIYDNELIQLFCNSISNYDLNDCYHNLSGKLYYLKSDSFERDRKSKEINRITAFEIDINSYRVLDKSLKVNINVVTFTRLDLLLKYTHDKIQQEKILRLPKYIVDDCGNFRRMLKDDHYPEHKIFVAKTFNKRNVQPFLNFDNVSGFLNSKMGALYQFMKDSNELIGNFIKLSFKEIHKTNIIKNNSEKLIYKNEKEYFELVNEKGIVIVNKVEDDWLATDFLLVLKEKLRNIGIDKVEIDSKINILKNNIVIVHDPEYYKIRKIEDVYCKSNHVQHMIFENYIGGKDDSRHINLEQTAIKKILYELLIKTDIQNKKISLYDWKSASIIRYAIPGKFENKGFIERCFYVLSVFPDSTFEYKYVNEDSNKELYVKLCVMIDQFKKKYIREFELEAIVFDETETVLIINNKIHTVPDLDEIYISLNNYSKDKRIESENLISIINEFQNEYPKYSEKTNSIIKAINDSCKNSFSYEEITNASNETKTNYVKPLFNLREKSAKDFVLFAKKKYNVIFNPLFKNTENDEIIRSATMNINTYHNELDILDKRVHYFVGSKKSLKDFSIQKSFIVRTLEPLNFKNKELIDVLLEQINVDFVRLGEYTVFPFPIKYLNEMNNNE